MLNFNTETLYNNNVFFFYNHNRARLGGSHSCWRQSCSRCNEEDWFNEEHLVHCTSRCCELIILSLLHIIIIMTFSSLVISIWELKALLHPEHATCTHTNYYVGVVTKGVVLNGGVQLACSRILRAASTHTALCSDATMTRAGSTYSPSIIRRNSPVF